MANLHPRTHPIDDLAQDWRALCRSTAAACAYARLLEAEPSVAATGAPDLGTLVERIAPQDRRGRTPHALHPSSPPASARAIENAAIVRALLRSVSLHPMVARALVQALLPGLVGVARRLTWGAGGEWEDGAAFFCDLVATTWELVLEWAGEDRPYAVLDLLSAARCRLRRRLLATRARRRAELTSDLPLPEPEAPGGGQSALDTLARTISSEATRTISATDASVLYAHRVLGFTVKELAQATGRSRRHISHTSERAAAALLA